VAYIELINCLYLEREKLEREHVCHVRVRIVPISVSLPGEYILGLLLEGMQRFLIQIKNPIFKRRRRTLHMRRRRN